MSFSLNKSRVFLGGMLVLTLWMVWRVNHLEKPASENVSLAVSKGESSNSKLKALTTPKSDSLKRVWREDFESDPFEPRKWYVPPPPKTEVKQTPQQQEAPPLPFTYFGKMEDKSGRALTFLLRGDRTYTISPGSLIDGAYRVDDVDGENIYFTYLPLGKKQVLSKKQTQNKTMIPTLQESIEDHKKRLMKKIQAGEPIDDSD